MEPDRLMASDDYSRGLRLDTKKLFVRFPGK